MKNQFLFDNAIALTIGTVLFLTIYIVVLARICNSLILKKKVSDYDNSDRIIISSIILSFLLNLRPVIDPLYHMINQYKYSMYNKEFTLQIVTRAYSFIMVATLYSIAGLVIVSVVSKMINQKPNAATDLDDNFGKGIFYGMILTGVTLLLKEHLIVVLNSLIEINTVPIFN